MEILDGLPPIGNASQQAKVNALRELQSQTQEDLEANLATPWVGG
jgi:hypothetical protein